MPANGVDWALAAAGASTARASAIAAMVFMVIFLTLYVCEKFRLLRLPHVTAGIHWRNETSGAVRKFSRTVSER